MASANSCFIVFINFGGLFFLGKFCLSLADFFVNSILSTFNLHSSVNCHEIVISQLLHSNQSQTTDNILTPRHVTS